MRTYISGRISGLDFEDVLIKFRGAVELLENIGLEPVNPLDNGLDRNESWENHMIKDIEILLSCDAVLMLDNWVDSRGARIEKVVAEESGKILLFESVIAGDKRLDDIKNAIQSATGMRFEDYTKTGRQRKEYFARMIFINYCREHERMSFFRIAELVNRNHATVIHCTKSYPSELRYNTEFRNLAQRVEKNLSNNVSE